MCNAVQMTSYAQVLTFKVHISIRILLPSPSPKHFLQRKLRHSLEFRRPLAGLTFGMKTWRCQRFDLSSVDRRQCLTPPRRPAVVRMRISRELLHPRRPEEASPVNSPRYKPTLRRSMADSAQSAALISRLTVAFCSFR